MLRIDVLERFGIFAAPNFLDRTTCDRIREEVVQAVGAPATVTVRLTQDELHERYRRTTIAQVSPSTVALVEARLAAMQTVLEERFRRNLDGCETPQFLLYREGDFIRRHADGAHEDEAPAWLRRRAVSVVTFLTDESEEPAPGTFGGGALTFYGLLKQDSRGQSVGLPIRAVAGLLVAFPADMLHGVSEVTRGQRCTIVSWFRDAKPRKGL
jgi:predicted 2-oxoglutarate/Fe(II)-dependent dioxygenase YbiX